jgi:hypothetical protein
MGRKRKHSTSSTSSTTRRRSSSGGRRRSSSKSKGRRRSSSKNKFFTWFKQNRARLVRENPNLKQSELAKIAGAEYRNSKK